MKHLFKSVLSGLIVLAMTGCTGGKGGDTPSGGSSANKNANAGMYTCYSLLMDGIQYGASEELYLDLKDDGKVIAEIYEKEEGTYTVSGNTITLTLPSEEVSGVIQNGLITIDDGYGMVVSFAKEGVTPPEVTMEANIDPNEIQFGYQYLYDDPDSYDKDQSAYEFWYFNGIPNTEDYITFDGNSYMTIGADENYRYEVVDKHIVDFDTKGEVFDIVFPDMYTCFDLVSGTCWARSNETYLLYSLCETDWVSENGISVYRFYSDYTFENYFPNDDETYTGTWYMEDSNHLVDVDTNGDSSRLSIFYDRTSEWFTVRGFYESLSDQYFYRSE